MQVKSNIGHTEGAAGLAGLIKAVLALEHRQIPPNVNFLTPNPNSTLSSDQSTLYNCLFPLVLFEEAGLTVPVDVLPWPADRKERVSVNCFGVGGTNAHVGGLAHLKGYTSSQDRSLWIQLHR